MIFYCSIGRFECFNSRFGRKKADELLCRIKGVLEADMGEGEYVCRLSAGHFGVLMRSIPPEAAERLVWKWNELTERWLETEGCSFAAALECGVYYVNEPLLDVPSMMAKANAARENMSRTDRNSGAFRVYDTKLEMKLWHERELEDRMEEALRDDEFKMFLQPKYRLSDGTADGAEALCRWIIPGRETLLPGDFIPLFDKNGFIAKLDTYIFERACAFIRRTLDSGKTPVPLSVNLSRVYLEYGSFLKNCRDIWKTYGFPAKLIEFELTETAVSERGGQMAPVLTEIRRAGFRCSIGDFGSGYSSLDLLGDIDVDAVKLDRRFFRHKPGCSDRDIVVIRSIVRLAKELDIQVVAEGVEEKGQADFLRTIGCDLVQGFCYARPVPEEAFSACLETIHTDILGTDVSGPFAELEGISS